MIKYNPYISVVIPTGEGRLENLKIVLESLAKQTMPVKEVIVVCDGFSPFDIPDDFRNYGAGFYGIKKHQPGMQPPRNVGVDHITEDVDYVWFLDSDCFVVPEASKAIYSEIIYIEENVLEPRIICGPYDWLAKDQRDWRNWKNLKTKELDYRWDWFKKYSNHKSFKHNLGAALANFSGNLIWPIKEFKEVGGFHPDLSAGRVDDGELGLRASSHGIPTVFCRYARAFHLWHKTNNKWKIETNAREVPLINEWHPWVQEKGLVLSQEDGARFDRICSKCNQQINSLLWWTHDEECVSKDRAK